jgi:hypothetical protein
MRAAAAPLTRPRNWCAKDRERQAYASRPGQGFGEHPVIGWVGRAVELHVEEYPLGSGAGELVGQFGVIAARPGRYAADEAVRRIVHLHDDDVAARHVPVEAVSSGAKDVLADFAKAKGAEDQPRNGDPKQGPPGLWRRPVEVTCVHVTHMRA